MSEIKFNYSGKEIIIHGKAEETMNQYINKFINKSKEKIENLSFLYNGNKINEAFTFVQQANEIDKSKNEMNIIVLDNKNTQNNISEKKSKNIICPECKENIRIKINKQGIILYECRNEHKKENISLEEFENTQYIDESKIICDDCKVKTKNETYENNFYICLKCKLNLCPICKNEHDKSHNFIDYDNKIYYCDIHYDIYTLYCINCKKDICAICEKEHINHKLLTYGKIMPDIDNAINKLEEMKNCIDLLKNDIIKIIKNLNIFIKNLDNYYNLSSDIIKNFESSKKNYPILQNINYIIDFIKLFNKNISEMNITNKFDNIINSFLNKEINEKEKKYEYVKNNYGYNIEKEDFLFKKEYSNKDFPKFKLMDNTYKNFDISSLKEDKRYKAIYNIKKMIILKNKRILAYHEYNDDEESTNYKLYVYNIKNDIRIDFSFDTDSIDDIFQMDDNNIIIKESKKIKLIKLKENTFEILNQLNDDNSKIFKPLEKTIITTGNDQLFIFYSYEKDKLIKNKAKVVEDNIYGLCGISQNEIAIYYYKEGKSYSWKAFLLFYNMNNTEENKTLNLGDGEEGGIIQLINKNTLILERNKKIVIIDIDNKIVKKEIIIDYYISDLISINENKFLIRKYDEIIQYEIDNYNIKLKSRKKINSIMIRKYPCNKLIIINDKEFIIYKG